MKNKNTLKWLWNITGKKKGYIVTLTLLHALQGGVGVFFALFLRAVVDSAVARDKKSFYHSVFYIIGLVCIQITVSAIIRWLHELAKSSIENTFKQRLFGCILRKDYSAVSSVHTAEWINRITSDTSVVASNAVEIIPGLVGTIVRLLSALVMIIALDRWFAFVLIPGGIILIILTYSFRKVLKRLHKRIQETESAS